MVSFSTSVVFEPPTFEDAARYLNSETNLLRNDDRPMSSHSFVKPNPRTLEKRTSRENAPPLKLLCGSVLNCQ